MSLLDTSMAGGQTAFETLDGAFVINEGVINFSKLLLTGTAATVSTTGTVNLPLWTMDLENSIQLTEPADAPPLKTSFRGPLDNPGKTLGKSALDSYIGNQVEKAIGDAILDKLQDKGIMAKPVAGTVAPQNAGEVLQNLIQQKIAPQAPADVIPAPVTVITPSVPLVAPVVAEPAVVAPVVAPAIEAVPVPEVAPAIEAVPEAVSTSVVPTPVEAPAVAPEAVPAEGAGAEDPIGNLIEGLTDQ